ncbi:MAG: hypothetical protein WAQ98_20320 [Blastocatellia bacterium]
MQQESYLGLILILACVALALVVASAIWQERLRKRELSYLVLDLLINGSLSEEEIYINVNSSRELGQINTYEVIDNLLKQELIIGYVEDKELDEKVYIITPKGKKFHQNYIEWELAELEKQKYFLRKTGDLRQFKMVVYKECELKDKLIEIHYK